MNTILFTLYLVLLVSWAGAVPLETTPDRNLTEKRIVKRTDCKKTGPNCHWEGAGPFCNDGNWCPPGYNHICKDGWGDTSVYCWTGYKALCCKS